ncbi:ferric-chelate reductase Frp1 [Coniosporium apollinis]|uniref:ferric-chelate reductase (NADPH) n=1 Tax=Coniosporium apollinis TaxID=61459 RepID=A0ABQ9NWC7_9PEZI|nr:ferric-chelate reductase Frp1 [Coniosporium apollinis]
MSHDHSSMSSGQGSMSTGSGVPTNFEIQELYWAFVGAGIAAAAAVNIIDYAIYYQRLYSARRGLPLPAKPKSLLLRTNATITATTREFANASFAPLSFRRHTIPLPGVGRTTLVLANLILLIVLCFYGLDTKDRWSYEDIGYRTGFVCITQLPLIFLLAGKKNIIGWLTGTSYERLNWLHRWTSRCLLLTATIHGGYWIAAWAPYGDFALKKIRTDHLTQTGVITWAILVWIVFSSSLPIRGWNYEFFVLQHLASFVVFMYFVYSHTPSEVHIWIWIPVGIFVFDRLVRALYVIYTNLSIFHPKQRKQGQISGLWACKAEFTPLPHDTTRISIANPPISWSAGQHVFLSCHSVVPLQSHPFTIASIPSDGRMEFIVKAGKGGTRRIFKHAEKNHILPTAASQIVLRAKSVAIEGPYGRIRPLEQFDTVIFFAGSSGASFTVPLLRDIVRKWCTAVAVTRRIRFVWVVKSKGQLSWFAAQLSEAMEAVRHLQGDGLDVEINMSIYVTCDESFAEEHKSLLTASDPSPAQATRGRVEKSEATELDEKDELRKNNTEQAHQVREIDPRADSQTSKACGPDGTCCCITTIDSEDAAITAVDITCTCNCGPSSSSSAAAPTKPSSTTSSSTSPTLTSSASPKPFLDPGITVLSGRPQPRNIIRKALEQALGESAVVVCGPQGLVDSVRRSVVGLSDERAVHKGTGAQGIYLHCEAFGL